MRGIDGTVRMCSNEARIDLTFLLAKNFPSKIIIIELFLTMS